MSIERKMIVRGAVAAGIPLSIALALLASQDQQPNSPWPDHNKFPGSATPVPAKIVPSLTPSPADLLVYDGRGNPSPTVTAGLPRVSPPPFPTPSPETVDARTTPAAWQGGVGGPTFNDQRFGQEGISPHQPEAFMNRWIAVCNKPEKAVRTGALAGIVEAILTRLSRRAEASPLDRSDSLSRELQPKTAEELIKCLQGIEETRPFLSDKDQAKKFGFQPVDVKGWELGKNVAVLGMDTTVNWQVKLTGELQKRGFRMSQETMNTLLRSPVTTFLNPKTGKLDTFTVQTLDDADQVAKKRLAGELSFHSSSEDRWVLIDLETKQVIASFTRCDNLSVPAPTEQISTLTPAPKPPEVPPTATSTPQPQQPTQPPTTATSTNTPPAPETASPTPTVPPSPRSTETPVPPQPPTSVPTSTPGQEIPPTSTKAATVTPFPPQTPIPGSSPTPTARPATETPIRP